VCACAISAAKLGQRVAGSERKFRLPARFPRARDFRGDAWTARLRSVMVRHWSMLVRNDPARRHVVCGQRRRVSGP
jgi:hypothetical protein